MKKIDTQNPDASEAKAREKYPTRTGAQYSLELVAAIASQLLKRDDYAGAAQKALLLIAACDKELAWRNETGLRIHLEFSEVLEFVTGQKREDRALPDYRRFLEDNYQRRSPFIRKFDIKRVRDEGLSLLEARRQRELFKKWKANIKSASARQKGKLGAEARLRKKRLVAANQA